VGFNYVKTQNPRKYYTLTSTVFLLLCKNFVQVNAWVEMNRIRTKQIEKGVAHLRVSAPGQKRSGLGIAAQLSIIKGFFKSNNILLDRVFIEYGSGRPRKRPKLQKTFDYCRKHNRTLYLANQSRLARNVGVIYDLIESGFKYIYIENPTADKYTKLWQAIVDEKTGDDISTNTKNALLSAAKKGIRLGGNSRKRIKTLKRKKRAYLKKVKPTIRREQKKYKTIRGLMGRLNRMRFKKRNGKRGGWSVSEVHGLLRDL
jgi:DNA invertase Pin-like site-specific DNA recombinase